MIHCKMTYDEIASEVNSDLPSLWEKKQYYERRFLQDTSKARTFPFTRVYEPGIKGLNNSYFFSFTILSPQKTAQPLLAISCKACDYKRIALLFLNPNVLTFYSNHFLERYKERVLKDGNATYDAVIESILINERALSGCEITKELEEIFHCFDGHFSDDKIDLLLTNSYGYSFAEKRGNIVFVKTVVTPEMLSDRQKELFIQVKAHNDFVNTLYYANPELQPRLYSGWAGVQGPIKR